MKEIQIPGYTTNIQAEDALAVGAFGKEGTGKTRFGITQPDPIGVIPLDRKTRRTVEIVAKELGKTVVMPKADFIRVANPMEIAVLKPDCGQAIHIPLAQANHPTCCAKHYYRWHVNRVKNAAFTLYSNLNIRSMLVDTGSQLWEDILFAHYGRNDRIMPRDRGPANQEMIDFLNTLSGKNLVITHKAREVWKNDKPTGKFERSGFPHLGYHVNVLLEFCCDENIATDEETGTAEGRFYANCTLCQVNPELQGPGGKKMLVDDQITFQYLAARIFEHDDSYNPEDWE